MFYVPVIFAALFCQISANQYSVPQPKIEVFSPKGLRISIPDAPGVTSVSFYLSFDHPIADNDPGSVAKEIDDKEGSYWIYYNPSVLLNLHDKVNYRLAVHKNGLTWTREGVEPVLQVVSLADNRVLSVAEDCDEGQQLLNAFPNLDQITDSSKTSAQSSQIKSAYSMHKSMPMSPAVTRTSTTTTTGTFLVKPTGEVESSGYKAASSFDSARREGEKWQHSKSELTAEEIEELKRIHGHEFITMPEHFQGGGSYGGSSGSYRQSSYSSSSQNSRPMYTSSWNQETGQTADMLPLVRPSGGSGYSTFSKYEKHESSNSAPVITQQPASGMFSSSSDSSYFQPPVVRPDVGNIQLAANPTGYSAQTKYHRKETKSSTGPLVTYPTGGSSTKVTETYESTSPQRTVVVPPNPLSSQYLSTSIFRSTVKPSSTYSCSAADYGFKRPDQIDVAALDRTVQELQCLAVFAEDSLKTEIRTLKEANYNLESRLTVLESQFQKFKTECQCGY